MEVTDTYVLVSAITAVRGALSLSNKGVPESAWISKLAADLEQTTLCQSAYLYNTLVEFTWTGTQFRTIPDLYDLIWKLEELAHMLISDPEASHIIREPECQMLCIMKTCVSFIDIIVFENNL